MAPGERFCDLPTPVSTAEVVETTTQRTDAGQFWSLEDGRFDGRYDEPDPVMAALEGA